MSTMSFGEGMSPHAKIWITSLYAKYSQDEKSNNSTYSKMSKKKKWTPFVIHGDLQVYGDF